MLALFWWWVVFFVQCYILCKIQKQLWMAANMCILVKNWIWRWMLLCSCCWQSKLLLSNFLKPILILCQDDLFFMVQKQWYVKWNERVCGWVVWDGKEGPGVFSFQIFFLLNLFPLFQIKVELLLFYHPEKKRNF